MPAASRPGPPGVDGRADTLADLFWAVAREVRHAGREHPGPADIPPSHARALVTLLRSGPVRLSALSDLLRIAPRSTTEVVDGLQDKGLVVRRPDPGDRRATLVEVTDAGRAAGRSLRAARSRQADAFFARLRADDRAELARILRELLPN